MPATGALILCIALILVFFRLDRDNKAQISSALWIPTIWALIIGSRMVSGWLQSSDSEISAEAYADGSPLDRNIFLVLIVAALIVVIRRKVNLAAIFRSNRWFIFYLAFCG